MKELFTRLSQYLYENKYDGLFFSSTNEFLMEYNVLDLNSSYKLTGFSGSQSFGLCTKTKVYLFVDTRYHAQADIEVTEDFIEVVKVPLEQSVINSFFDVIPDNFKLAVPTKKISKVLYEKFSDIIKQKNGVIVPLSEDPIEQFYSVFRKDNDFSILKVSDNISGKSSDDKIRNLIKKYKGHTLIITDLSDIAYLTNLRSFDFPYSSTFPSKMIVNKNGAVLYINSCISLNSDILQTKFFNSFYDDIKNIRNSTVYYQNSSISMCDYLLIDNSNQLKNTDFSKIKSVKNKFELSHLDKCFHASDVSLGIIDKMLNSDIEYSEFDYSKALVESLYKNGAYGLSFKPIVACGDNSAIIHYSSPSKDKFIKNGDFLLIDYGAFYGGGYATDTTRTFVKGKPSKEQKKVYTIVLKAFLNAYHKPAKLYYDIDMHARKVIDKNLGCEYPFAHSTGHGVGINVHEVPPRVSNTDISKVNIKNNTVFSIEPGAYKQNFGGVRLENTVCAKKDKNKIYFKSFSKYKFEDKLVDKSLLNSLELKWYNAWQEEYERTYLD